MKGLPRILNRTASKMLNVKSYYSSLSHRSGEYEIASTITLTKKQSQLATPSPPEHATQQKATKAETRHRQYTPAYDATKTSTTLAPSKKKVKKNPLWPFKAHPQY